MCLLVTNNNVRVYRRNGASWGSFQTLANPSTSGNPIRFADTIAISRDGNVIAIGDYSENAAGVGTCVE